MIAILFLILNYWLGDSICRRFFTFLSIPHRIAVSFITGLAISGIVSYLAALLFSRTSQPLLWADIVFTILAAAAIYWLRQPTSGQEPGDGTLRRMYARITRSRRSSPDDLAGPVFRWDADRRPGGNALTDGLVFAACIIFGCWLTFATLNFDDGNLRFAARAWSDFGPHLSLSQSIVLGNNFPTEHPFLPGEFVKYHFLLWFSAANLEYLGLNIALAVNLLSMLSLGSLLLQIMALGESLFGSRAVGRLGAVLFFFAATSLSYIPFLYSHPDIWDALRNIWKANQFLDSGYPFRGESWGALSISVYFYQRHLIYGAGMLLVVLVYLIDLYKRRLKALDPVNETLPRQAGPQEAAQVEFTGNSSEHDQLSTLETSHLTSENDPEISVPDDDEPPADRLVDEIEPVRKPAAKTSYGWLDTAGLRLDLPGLLFAGFLVGAMPYWNSATFAATAFILAGFFVFVGCRLRTLIVIAVTIAVGLPQVMLFRSGNFASSAYSLFHWGYTMPDASVFAILKYIVWTFGFKLGLVVVAFWFSDSFQRRVLIAVTMLLVATFCLQLSTDSFNNHKLINVWNIVAGLYAAYALYRIGKGGIVRLILASILCILMVLGAVIDLVPIHNDRFISVPFEGDRLMTWVLNETEPDDIFLTDTYMSSPIMFAGRRIYMGHPLFGWAAGYDMNDRGKQHKKMFEELVPERLFDLLKQNRIAYVGIDDGLRSNKDYRTLNESVYKRYFEVVFGDTEHNYSNLTIYRVPESWSGRPTTSDLPTTTADGERSVSAFAGGVGIAPGEFRGPRGIATDTAGNLYVADTENSRIQKFSKDGKFISQIGLPGRTAGELVEPNGIAIGPSGQIFVTDAARQRLILFAGDGTFTKEWSGPDTPFFGPRDIAIDKSGRVFILDQGNARVVVFDPETEEYDVWGNRGSGDGELFEPTGIEVSSDKVYVADSLNDRIEVFGLNGSFIAAWPVPEWKAYPWQYPDIVFDSKTRQFYVTSPITREILIFDPDGNRIGKLANAALSDLENPSALAIGNSSGERRLFVLNTGKPNVHFYELTPDEPANTAK